MQNKYQCPQCAGTSTHKVSETEYHCDYCQSTFSVEISVDETLANLFTSISSQQAKTPEELQAKIASDKKRSEESRVKIDLAKKKSKQITIIILSIVFAFFSVFSFFIFRDVKKKTDWQKSNLKDFKVFAGSKGEVCWLLFSQNKGHLDSVKYTLKIINPKNNTALNELLYLPVMTWHESFKADKYYDKLIPFGDTVWIPSDENGLMARDIYTGNTIVDAQKLAIRFPQLAKGITKAKYESSENTFLLSTTDGFDYVFNPSTNKFYTKDEVRKEKKSILAERTFFILSENKRPHLFKSVENANPIAKSSIWARDLENEFKDKEFLSRNRNVLSLTPLNPDMVYFNGKIIDADNEKAWVLYQTDNSKNAQLCLACISVTGKELWKISGNDLKEFAGVYTESKSNINISISKNVFVFYYNYPTPNAVAINSQTGKMNWKYNFETKL